MITDSNIDDKIILINLQSCKNYLIKLLSYLNFGEFKWNFVISYLDTEINAN